MLLKEENLLQLNAIRLVVIQTESTATALLLLLLLFFFFLIMYTRGLDLDMITMHIAQGGRERVPLL